MRRRHLILVAAACAILLGLPGAVAQVPPLATYTVAVTATPAPDPIVPLVQTAQASIIVTVGCSAQSLRTSSAPLEVRINASTTSPEAAVAWSPHEAEVDFTRQQCLDGHTVDIPVVVNMSIGAGARARDQVGFSARADLPSEGVTAETSWTQEVGLRLAHAARFDEERWTAQRGRTLTITGTVDNLANSDVSFRFGLAEGSSADLEVALPQGLAVALGGSAPFTVNVNVTGLGKGARADALVLSVAPAIEGQPAVIGKSSVIMTTIDSPARPTKDSPGPSAVAFLLLAGLLAWCRHVPMRSRKL